MRFRTSLNATHLVGEKTAIDERSDLSRLRLEPGHGVLHEDDQGLLGGCARTGVGVQHGYVERNGQCFTDGLDVVASHADARRDDPLIYYRSRYTSTR